MRKMRRIMGMAGKQQQRQTHAGPNRETDGTTDQQPKGHEKNGHNVLEQAKILVQSEYLVPMIHSA